MMQVNEKYVEWLQSLSTTQLIGHCHDYLQALKLLVDELEIPSTSEARRADIKAEIEALITGWDNSWRSDHNGQ